MGSALWKWLVSVQRKGHTNFPWEAFEILHLTQRKENNSYYCIALYIFNQSMGSQLFSIYHAMISTVKWQIHQYIPTSMKNTQNFHAALNIFWHLHVFGLMERLSLHLKAQSWWGNMAMPWVTDGFELRSWQFGWNYVIQQAHFTAKSSATYTVISLKVLQSRNKWVRNRCHCQVKLKTKNFNFVCNICLEYLQHRQMG